MDCNAEVTERLSAQAQSLYEAFQQVTDPRKRRGVRYPLAVLLTVITLAKMSGEQDLRGIAQWARYRAKVVWAAFGQERTQMPHWTTYSRVLSLMDEDSLQRAITCGLGQVREGKHLTLDGKTLRGTIPAEKSRGEHQLTLYEPDSRRVLAQAWVDEKANEITAAPVLLAQANLSGKVVTGDAMFTQRDLSKQVVEAGGHYIWQVKDNQPLLRKTIIRLFEPETLSPGHGSLHTDFRCAHEFSKGHGRLEYRSLTASCLLQDYCDWPHLGQVFRLERHRQAGAVTTTDVTYGVTSLRASAASPQALLAFIRCHWRVENQLHHVRDVSLREDACRLVAPTAQRCLAHLNNLIVALLPRTPFKFLPDAQRFFAAHLSHALALLL